MGVLKKEMLIFMKTFCGRVVSGVVAARGSGGVMGL